MSEKVKIKRKGETGALRLPMMALRGLVVFPNMVLHFDVVRAKSIASLAQAMEGDRKIFLTAQRDIENDDPAFDDLCRVGVVAEVRQVVRVQSDMVRVLVEGKYRARLLEYYPGDKPSGMVAEYPISMRGATQPICLALMRTVKELFEEYSTLVPQMPREMVTGVLLSSDPNYVAEYIAGNIQLKPEDKQKILESNSVIRRLEYLAHLLENENEILSLENDIHQKVQDEMDKSQREYYLREQMRVISEELGEGEDLIAEADKYRKKIAELNLNEECTKKLTSEVERLTKMPDNSHEASVIRTWLDTCLELPWNTFTEDKLDIKKAEKYLNKEHYGLAKVKERIIEQLAVRQLAPDIKGQILCLVGPPGVGKTSIAHSIAESMGRHYVRMSLGGVRDESDIRGHRKTYIGSMPGRIITAIKQAGTANPVLLLDEVDKLGMDMRGDPSAALLEVLDSEQNFAFRDHFIELPFDLSRVFFIATANYKDAIPVPLLDRMEIIELSSYTREEKFHIAKKHLIPKQFARHGLKDSDIGFSDGAIYALIDGYTREAGVRSLERQISAVCRKAATKIVSGDVTGRIALKAGDLEAFAGPRRFLDDDILKSDQVGVANGLAWTSAGGEMLQVEAAVMEGSGKDRSTGSLGEVMKESVEAAITYIRTVADQYGISPTFYKDKDIHIHFPEGAVPKDGPSAGITTCTALVSALSGIPVRHDVAMTGEITLRGRVLPIGGLREKTMAAYKYKMKTVIIPEANMADLADIDDAVKSALTFVPVSSMDMVLKTALVGGIKHDKKPHIQPRQGEQTPAAPAAH